MNSVFDPDFQRNDLDSKLIASLERISQVFRVLLWQDAKENGLSPVQLQILVFLFYHSTEQRNITNLAREFNMTKATISDSVRVLSTKGFVEKEITSSDGRSSVLNLSLKGNALAGQSALFAQPLKTSLQSISNEQKEATYKFLLQMIRQLQQVGIINSHRMCYGCRYHSFLEEGSYCGLMQQQLSVNQLQIDCKEWEQKN